MQRDARALLPRELAAVQRRLAGERAQQRRLARAVRPGERQAVGALDLERDVVEENRAGKLLAERGCDQDCHGGKLSPACERRVSESVVLTEDDPESLSSWQRTPRRSGGKHGDRTAFDRHDSHPVDGRGARGKCRTSRHCDGPRADRVSPLHGGPAAQPGEPALVQPGPVRVERRPCVHPAVLGAAPLRLQPLARGAQALPQVGVRDSGASGVPAHGGHRGHDRPARPGPLERRRHGLRRAVSRRHLQPAAARDRRPPRLRDLLRRRPDGRRLLRVVVDRRHERARQAHLLLRRQPHHDRRDDRRSRSPRIAPRASRRRAGTFSTSPT